MNLERKQDSYLWLALGLAVACSSCRCWTQSATVDVGDRRSTIREGLPARAVISRLGWPDFVKYPTHGFGRGCDDGEWWYRSGESNWFVVCFDEAQAWEEERTDKHHRVVGWWREGQELVWADVYLPGDYYASLVEKFGRTLIWPDEVDEDRIISCPAEQAHSEREPALELEVKPTE